MTTISWSTPFRYSSASAALSKWANPRLPAMPCFSTSSLMNVLEVSILAAALVGAAQGTPIASRASTMPFSRGASGPMKASSTPFSFAKAQTFSTSFSSQSRCSLDLAMIPGLAFFITA